MSAWFIVHARIYQYHRSGKSAESCDAIAAWLPRMHAIVVGPGLGRDVPILRTVKAVISVARKQQKSVVIDAVSDCVSSLCEL